MPTAAPAEKQEVLSFAHELLSIGIPASGYAEFRCLSSPEVRMTIYEALPRCPLCLKFNPLRDSLEGGKL